MIIDLKAEAGEFCTVRTHPKLPNLIHKIKEALLKGESVEIQWSHVKILTPSFLDELIPPLMIELGYDLLKQKVTFNPPLTGFLAEQPDRGFSNRKKI